MRRCQGPYCGLPLPAQAHRNLRYCERRCRDQADYIRNRSERIAQQRLYDAANRDRIKARMRDYHEANRPVIIAQKRARRAMLRRRRQAFHE